MSVDTSTLAIQVKSDGISQASSSLNALTASARNAEKQVSALAQALERLEKANKSAVTQAQSQIENSDRAAKATDGVTASLAKLQAEANRMNSAWERGKSLNIVGARQEEAAAIKAVSMAQEKLNSAQDAGNKLNLVGQRSQQISAIKDQEAAMAKLQTEANRMNASWERGKSLNMAGFRQQEVSSLKLSEDAVRKYAAAQELANRMNAAFDRSSNTRGIKDSASAMSALQAEANKMNVAWDKGIALNQAGARAMELAKRSTSGAAAATVAHNEAMREAHALARGLSGSLGALWVTYGNLAGMAAGVAIGMSLKGVLTVGKDVENTLEGLRVKGQETIESVNAIRASVIDLGKGVYGPQEVAKAFEVMIMAGLNAKQALSGISDALNLATVGGTTIEKSAQTLVQVGTALGYSAENYSRIADVIAMTAAASMSSVESLSEAFKSGSVVGKLYGVTLVDIGTSLAALSNLGIQGSAAGTSLKNFYKELASSSEKVKNTLKDMKLAPTDFKDAQGNYLGVLQVVEKLAGGLDNLTLAQQKIAIANLSNERGMKTAVELLDLYRQKVQDTTKSGEEHGNMLSELRKKIEESYGFAAIGAAQMSLTVSSQLKSVANTLQVVFLEAFQNVSPQISIVAANLKAAFKSKEFLDGITAIAESVAKLTVTIAENIPTIVKLVEAFLAFKAFMFVVELFTAMRTAFLAAAGGAAILGASLGPVAVALLAVGAAYAFFTREKEKSADSTSFTNAVNYSKDYSEALSKEAERLRTQITLMQQGKSARDADTESIYAQNIALAKAQGDKAKRDAQERFWSASEKVSSRDLEVSASIVARGGMATTAVKEFTAAQQNLHVVNTKVDADFEKLKVDQKEVMDLAAKKEQIRAQQEKDANAGKVGGTGVISEKVKGQHARDNDEFLAQEKYLANEVKGIQQDLLNFQTNAQSLYKQGEMGKLQLISVTSAAQKKALQDEIAILQDSYEHAASNKDALNKRADMERISGQIQAKTKELADNEIKLHNDTAVELVKIDEMTTQLQIKEYEKRGEYVKAAELKYGDFAVSVKQDSEDIAYSIAMINLAMVASLSDPTAFAKFDELLSKLQASLKRMNTNKALHVTVIDEAGVRQSAAAFDVLMKGVEAEIASVDERAAKGGGWFAKFAAQDQIDAFIQQKLPALRVELDNLLAKAEKSQNPADMTAYEERLKKYNKYLNRQGNAYEDFMHEVDKIGSEGFNALFSNVNGSWSNYVKKMKDTFKTTLVDEIYKMFARPLILQLVGSFAGMIGMPGLAAAAGNAAGGSAVGSAGGSFLGGGIASMFGEFAGGMKAAWAAEQGIFGSFSSGLGYLTEGIGSAASSVGMMIPAIGVVVAGLYILAGLLDSGPEQDTHLTFKNNNAAGNTNMNERGNEGNTGSYIGSHSKSPFGTFGATDAFWMNAGTDPNHADQNAAFEKFYKGVSASDRGISKYLTGNEISSVTNKLNNTPITIHTGAEGADPTTALAGVFKQRIATILDGIESGMSSLIDGFDGSSAELQTEVETLLSIRKNIDQASKTFGEPVTLQSLAGAFETFKQDGETTGQVITRMGQEFVATSGIGLMFGKTQEQVWGKVGLASAEARDNLVTLAGGLDAFTAKQNTFYANYYTDQERGAMSVTQANQQLSEGFSKLNITIPDSTEGFRDLMAAQDLSTESGRETYNTLLGLSTAFTTVHGTAQQAAEAAAKTADLQIQLMDAQGLSYQALSAKRAKDIAAMSAEDGAIQTAINTAQDVANTKNLEIQILQLEGKSVEAVAMQREIELAKLSEGDKLLQQRIYDLQDEADATKKAAEAAQKLMDNLSGFAEAMDKLHGGTGYSTAQHQFEASSTMGAVTKAMPWIKDIDQLMTMTAEDFSHYSDANQGLILSALKAAGVVKDDLTASISAVGDAAQKAADDMKAAKDSLHSYHKAQMQLNGSTDVQQAQADVDYAFQTLTDSLSGTKLAGLSLNDAMHLTDEQFNSLTPAQKGYVIELVNTEGALNKATTAASNFSAGFVNAGDVVDQATAFFNAKFKEIQDNAATLAGGDTGKDFSNQISRMQDYMQQIQGSIDYWTEWSKHYEGGGAGLLAAQKQMGLAKEALEKLVKQYELYTKLEAAYPGHGKELLDLENWYTSQQEIFKGNQDDMTALQLLYEKKRADIIAGGLTDGLHMTADEIKTWVKSLRDWLKGLNQNSELSPLTAQQKMMDAQSTYMKDLDKAKAGDKDAREAITKDAETYLSALKAVTGFGGDYSSVYARIMKEIGDLADASDPATAAPTMVDPASFEPTNARIVETTNAIKDQTNEIVDLKIIIARLLEQNNDLMRKQTAQISGTITASGDSQTMAINRAAVSTERG